MAWSRLAQAHLVRGVGAAILPRFLRVGGALVHFLLGLSREALEGALPAVGARGCVGFRADRESRGRIALARGAAARGAVDATASLPVRRGHAARVARGAGRLHAVLRHGVGEGEFGGGSVICGVRFAARHGLAGVGRVGDESALRDLCAQRRGRGERAHG